MKQHAKTLFLLLTGIASLSLTGCTGNLESKIIETPESWQAHLKPVDVTKLPAATVEESVYVPIYSHIYVEDRRHSALLASTLSVRNTDIVNPIIITSAKYYSTDGKLLQEFVPSPVQMEPMASANFVIDRPDESGGSGANFVVVWRASAKVSDPLIESVMVGTGSSQSFGFTSRGVVTSHHSAAQIQKLPKPVTTEPQSATPSASTGAVTAPSGSALQSGSASPASTSKETTSREVNLPTSTSPAKSTSAVTSSATARSERIPKESDQSGKNNAADVSNAPVSGVSSSDSTHQLEKSAVHSATAPSKSSSTHSPSNDSTTGHAHAYAASAQQPHSPISARHAYQTQVPPAAPQIKSQRTPHIAPSR